jgi:DNA-binding NarL/FixJ family response regulator
MSDQMKVLVVDDVARARQSIKALLATLPQVEAMCEATNGRDAIDMMGTWLPDAVVMDIQMAEMDGLEATQIIKSRWPSVKVIVLSMYGDYEAQARTAGADDFVNKGEPPARLLAALETVAHYNC